VERIVAARKDSELKKIWAEMLETGFISCKIDPAKFSMKDEDFKGLSLKDKKRILMDLLDMNQLYVNYCDIDDKAFKVSAADKAFTKSFYGDK
jgi:adenine-specific DNA-methyltransferase